MTDEVHRQLTQLMAQQLSPGEQLSQLAWGQEEGSPGCLYFLIIAAGPQPGQRALRAFAAPATSCVCYAEARERRIG